MELELVEDAAAMFADAEAEAAEMALGQAAEVQNNAAVAEVAALPNAAAAEEPGALQRIANWCQNNPYGQALVKFAKFAAGATGTAAVAFGVMYGLNKATADKAHETGQRTALSEYLKGAEKVFTDAGLTWTQDIKQKAAEDALAFPWIDATQ